MMAGLLWYRSYMDSLANTRGYYPDIHAGHADRVAELTLEAPYLVRETPEGYNQLELMALVGGSVAWNQLVPFNKIHATQTINQVTMTNNGDGTVTFSGTATEHTAIPLTGGGGLYYEQDHVYFLGEGSNTAVPYDGYTGDGYRIAKWKRASITSGSGNSYYAYVAQGVAASGTFNANVTDLTALIGAELADYVYNLEQATAGSGIAWLKKYDLIDDQYHAYSQGSLESVEATSHIAKDGNGNVISTTPFGSVTLRGILMKDADGNLYYNGDTYEPDGTVTRYFGERTYQSGDESLTDAITDGTNTVYKLGAPTTESADPYTAVQDIEDGTEEFITSNNVPVGNVSIYRRA